jgi:hypothetical protein
LGVVGLVSWRFGRGGWGISAQPGDLGIFLKPLAVVLAQSWRATRSLGAR